MRPYMPPIQDFIPYLEKIWSSRQLTNGGALHAELEKELCQYLGVKYISLFSSGTLALTLALKALNLKGEVITTPFTAAATAQAIYWNNLTPVFADIDHEDFNISVSEIERAISPDTCALLPVHVFGNPCKVEKINQLAQKHNLKVIYDAAHCFGVQFNGESICNFGDLSVLSFHATKVFSTIEGGAVVCRGPATKEYIDTLKNTGISAVDLITGHGLNAKMNELQAGFGLLQLKYIDSVMEQRKNVAMHYRKLLHHLPGLKTLQDMHLVKHNYSYFPVLIDPDAFGKTRDELYAYLKANGIFARRYFYPLISNQCGFSNCKTGHLPIAENVARNILCLPLYHDLTLEDAEMVCNRIFTFAEE